MATECRHLWGQTLRIHQSQAASPVCPVHPTNPNSQSGAPFEWQPQPAPKAEPPSNGTRCNTEAKKASLPNRSWTKEAPDPTVQNKEPRRHGRKQVPKPAAEPKVWTGLA